MNFTLDQEQYEALIHLAQAGATTPDQKRQLNAWLRGIEEQNGVVRHSLWIQWQEADQRLPPSTQFPEKWPPEQRYYLEFISRPVNIEDVRAVLASRARRPVTILVTNDPGAILGWTPLEQFFVR